MKIVREASALVRKLVCEVRTAGNPFALHYTIDDIYRERARATKKAGLEHQVATILSEEGVERGAALIRGLIQGGQ